jgi:hypothetical protein
MKQNPEGRTRLMKMTTMIVTASVALFTGGAVQAMPVAPLAQSDATVTLVRGGCGFGEHRGPGRWLPTKPRPTGCYPAFNYRRAARLPARHGSGPARLLPSLIDVPDMSEPGEP